MHKIKRILVIYTVLLSTLLLTGCDVPKDPQDTLEHVKESKTLRIGVIYNPPWAENKNHLESGVENQLINEFAQSLQVQPKWFFLSEEEAFLALKYGQLDIVIGGLTDQNPYQSEAGFTRPYYTVYYFIGLPNGSIKKLEKYTKIAIYPGSWLSKYIKEKNLIPVEFTNPFSSGLPVAAAQWQLIQKNYILYQKLFQVKHVIAIHQGENKFLIKLEHFLENKKNAVNQLLGKPS